MRVAYDGTKATADDAGEAVPRIKREKARECSLRATTAEVWRFRPTTGRFAHTSDKPCDDGPDDTAGDGLKDRPTFEKSTPLEPIGRTDLPADADVTDVTD